MLSIPDKSVIVRSWKPSIPPPYEWLLKRKPRKNVCIHDLFIHNIKKQKEKEQIQDIWKNSLYKDLVKLKNNNIGIVGEAFINDLCKMLNIKAQSDGRKTIGRGTGDGIIMGNYVEIKTSCQGSKYPTFQHELGEVPWRIYDIC